MSRTKQTPSVDSQPQIGIAEWFRPGDHDRVERVLADMKTLGLTHLRTGFFWADYVTPEGAEWYAWLLPRLAQEVEVLPCFTSTPPALALEPDPTAPPSDPAAFAAFLSDVVDRLGTHFEWVELWNAPNHLYNWNHRLDPDGSLFSGMIAAAADVARQKGKKVVLAGTFPTDASWLDRMARYGVLARVDALGVHGFPGTWEFGWDDWTHPIAQVRAVLDRHGLAPEVWITAAGFSTWEHDEYEQLRVFRRLLDAPVTRAYWYTMHDLHPDQAGVHLAEHHYHLGLVRPDGRPKLLYRIWAERRLEGVRALAQLRSGDAASGAPLDALDVRLSAAGATMAPVYPLPSSGRSAVVTTTDRYALVTGGAGFVGTNVAHRLAAAGKTIRIFDNLSRPGVETNLRWLLDTHGPQRIQVQTDDVRNAAAVREAVRGADQVFHFAAQVAVTTSVHDPVEDFEINLRGTLNLLEALRALGTPPPLLFTSTNKVYGGLDDVGLTDTSGRYEPTDEAILRHGIGRSRPLDFHSPYGCSKGGADQYVLDYARIYDLPTVVFRMSCIYGPHQFGTEDQGWVAHFLIRALAGESITLYGDGKQVRDILFVEDLVDAMLRAHDQIDHLRGQAFNIGGGPSNAVSLLEIIDIIGRNTGSAPALQFDAWRPWDQRYYVSDIRDFMTATGWQPRVSYEEGVGHLHRWLVETRARGRSRLVA